MRKHNLKIDEVINFLKENDYKEEANSLAILTNTSQFICFNLNPDNTKLDLETFKKLTKDRSAFYKNLSVYKKVYTDGSGTFLSYSSVCKWTLYSDSSFY
jgi:hypothetical protein